MPTAPAASSRRSFLLRMLALTGVAAASAAYIGPRFYRRAFAPPPPTQVWMCTFRDCEPYFYVPAKGDPDNVSGSHPIPPGTAFENLPDDWICPVCGSSKEWFMKVKGEGNPERA